VDLSGNLARWNGMRCFCGIGGQTTEKLRGFWVMFPPVDAEPPEVVMIAVKNLVALPGPPPGATRTPWETKFGSLEGPGLEALEDEAAAEKRQEQKLLSLCDGAENEEEDDRSQDLSDSEDSSAGLVMEVGSLVKISGTLQLGTVEGMPAAESEDVQVQVLPDVTGGGGKKCFPRASLSVTEKQKAELEAVCSVCASEHPEEDLLICENFCRDCASTVHAQCLKPPQKVPAGDWYCSACSSQKRKSATEKGEGPAAKMRKPEAKSKAPKAKPKASVKAKASSKQK